MRFKTTLAMLCAAAVCLVCAGAVFAGSSGPGGVGAVRLVVARSAVRAGQVVRVTVVNSAPSAILRGLCLTLERRLGRRWVAVTRTHGVPVGCVASTGIVQPARSREQVGVPLYDDLGAGVYRVALRYESARGQPLGKLAGSQVQSVQARLVVGAFKPGPEPRLSESKILALATQAAAGAGDRSPLLIQHAEGTHFDAVLISSRNFVFEWNWSVLIAVRGHFTANGAPIPAGAKPPSGTVLTLVVNAASGQVTDFGIGDRYPPLAQLGPVTTDFGPRRRSAPPRPDDRQSGRRLAPN